MGDALEELRAMNAAPSGGRGPVRNQDKRTSRLDNKDSFQRAILQHRAELPAAIGIPAQVGETASRGIARVARDTPTHQQRTTIQP